MESFGNLIIYIMMAFVLIGAIASIRDDENGLGKEFKEGLHSIGAIFIPVAGIMAAIPYLSALVESAAGPLFDAIGADPAIAATSLIAVDMGGYQLAHETAATTGGWIMAAVVGYMAGATIIFTVPVGMAMVDRRDHRYMALGIMSGVLAIPIGVLITTTLLVATSTTVRGEVSGTSASDTALSGLDTGAILLNLLPLTVFVLALAAALWFVPNVMIRLFIWFGRILDALLKLVLAVSIIEHFTGVFSTVFGSWGFDPIIADTEDQYRALEVAGNIGIMLAGAFPMVYMLRKGLARPLGALGRRVGMSAEGTAGLLAAVANVLALFRLVRHMPPKDKVLCIAFAVCAAFLVGDHLAFTANFQPNLIGPLLVGKLVGGLLAIGLAALITMPVVRALAAQERDEDTAPAAS
ncbi:ethanolamine utilization protein EutH [Prauserella rugosa]|uniref:Ethanolamine transporter n=1 Tax=Prauserella rugosa TaxID=43354 RepID=A0A660C5Q1_9PSEU|nr:ethanolamine utilization protein EutH [Prauserella rugosa]KMS90145.1 ethanolamine utilization protein EutH [Streptomyces regensis]TWH18802.1 ethanolamine transporter [Prauserella rugosa]